MNSEYQKRLEEIYNFFDNEETAKDFSTEEQVFIDSRGQEWMLDFPIQNDNEEFPNYCLHHPSDMEPDVEHCSPPLIIFVLKKFRKEGTREAQYALYAVPRDPRMIEK